MESENIYIYNYIDFKLEGLFLELIGTKII